MKPRVKEQSNIPASLAPGIDSNPTASSSRRSVDLPEIPLDLKPLISPYRSHRRLTVRIEKLPQSARLSAGTNNGDRTWSLTLDELEGLSYIPQEGVCKEQMLSVRLIANDEIGASTVALIDFQVSSSTSRKKTLQPELVCLPGENASAKTGREALLKEELLLLKTALAEREAELTKLQTSIENANILQNREITAALCEAERIWKNDEARRLEATRATLQEEFARKLAATELSARADFSSLQERDAKALLDHQQRLAAAQDILSDRERELASLQLEFATLRSILEENASAHAKADRLVDAKGYSWTADEIIDLKKRCEAAEADLAAAQETSKIVACDANRNQEQKLSEMRLQLEAEFSAANAAADRKVAEKLAASEAEWKQRTTALMAEITTRCNAAEAALVSAQEARKVAARDANAQEQMLSKIRLQLEAALSGANAIADRKVAETLAAAEAEWNRRAAASLADITARCNEAEAALASAREAGKVAARDLNTQEQTLSKMRLQFEAEISAANAAVDRIVAERLAASEVEWKQRTAASLAEITTRCNAAETALVSIQEASKVSARDVENQEQILSKMRLQFEAELSAANAAADRIVAERLVATEAEWEKRTATLLAEITTRCNAAELALKSKDVNNSKGEAEDHYVLDLNREIKTLRSTLVEREVSIAKLQVSLEQIQAQPEPTNATPSWRPLSNKAISVTPDRLQHDGGRHHLLRDVAIVVVLAVFSVFMFPRIYGLLPDRIRWQIENVGGLINQNQSMIASTSSSNSTATPRVQHPIATVARSVNVRAQPSADAAVISTLKRGAQVAVTERRGNWAGVEISLIGGKVQKGWVYGSYLIDAAIHEKQL
jgi:hypothetical protein